MKRYITVICLLLTSVVCALADTAGFTTLDWEALRIDSVLPVYTEVVPLESDYTRYDYTVSLEYPELAPLSAREAEVAARYDSIIGEDLQVESSVGISRRQGMLDISFIPVVKRDGKYLKLLSAQVIITPVPRNGMRKASAKSVRYAAHSVLQSGKWVKISVTDDGMYQLTRSALKGMGFSKPENVHLYGYGGHVLPEVISASTHQDDLCEVPLYYSSKLDAWLFWGNGVVYWNGDTRVRNQYANAGCYFLTEADTASSIRTVSSSATPVKTYSTTRGHVLYEKEEYAWYTGGRNLFENINYASTNYHTYKLTTPDMVSSPAMTIVFTASDAATTTMTPTINGVAQTAMSMSPKADYVYATSTSKTYDLSSIGASDAWTVKLTSTSGHNARLDYIALSYERQLKPNEGFIPFTSSSSTATRFDITGSNIKVMRIGQLGSPAAMIQGTQEGTTYQVTVDDGSDDFVAFDETYSFPQPTVLGSIENQDLHQLDSLDMVIIIPTSGKLKGQAERLVAAHEQYDGLKVGIVRADQIYNEFSSGTPDATAYRRLMKMLYDKAATVSTAPRYLLLMGDCAWDNRMICSAWAKCDPDDYLLCYESENSFSDTKSYIMEDYFGLLDDGEGNSLLKNKSDLGIGRFPVLSAPEAKILVDKSINYMSNSNAGAWKNLVYMLGDDGDENEHMDYADRVAENILKQNPEIELHKVMWDAYTRVSTTSNNSYPDVTTLLKKQMQEGTLVLNYTGHAASYGLSHEFVLLREDFANTKGTKLPLWVTAACDVMPFDGQAANIGETAVMNEGGGALAFYGTTRTVYASQNYSMNNYFMKYLFANGSDGQRNRLGDAIRLAKEKIISDGRESGYMENKLQYALLGDPALTMGAPQQKVILDSINGKSISTSGMSLKAGEHVKLSGHLQSKAGDKLTDFSGTLTTRLFDSKETITCKNNTGAEDPFVFTDRNALLYESQDSVRSGDFEVEFIVPVDINYSDETCRFVFYAINNEKTLEADGYNESLPLGGIVDDLNDDQDGPDIVAYLGSEDFQNGDVVNAQPYFVARLEDESGISSSGNGVGHDLVLCIDNDPDKTYNLNEYYTHEFGDFTKGTVTYSIPALESGAHTLTFRAWDVLNNTQSVSLDFVVDTGVATNILNLTATQNPAVSNTNFVVTYDMPGSDCTIELEVFDFMGRRLWANTETVSSPTGQYTYSWNLTSGTGSRLGTGIYFYRCQIKCGDSKWNSKTQKIIVINNK